MLLVVADVRGQLTNSRSFPLLKYPLPSPPSAYRFEEKVESVTFCTLDALLAAGRVSGDHSKVRFCDGFIC